MTTQRAIVKGSIASIVEIRNMFTCNVVESGGDDYELLWTTYLDSIYNEVKGLLSDVVHFYSVELQNYALGSWVPFLEVTVDYTGTVTGTQLLNAASLVLIGKGAGLGHVGRKFFGAIAETSAAGNSLSGDYLADAAAALIAYITPFEGIGGGTIAPGVVDSSGVFHQFVGGSVSTLLGTMRRRKPGIGT